MTQNQRTLITSSIFPLGAGLALYILFASSISESFPLILQMIPLPAAFFVVYDQIERGVQNRFLRNWVPFICLLLPVLLLATLSSKVQAPIFRIEPNFTKDQFDALWNAYLKLFNEYNAQMYRNRSMYPALSLVGVGIYALLSRFAFSPLQAKTESHGL